MTATNLARALAAASIVAWLIGVVRIALALSANTGGPPDLVPAVRRDCAASCS